MALPRLLFVLVLSPLAAVGQGGKSRWPLLLLAHLATAAEDQSPHCSTWAAAGECDANPTYMQITCEQSCTLQKSANCAFWAAQGECDKNPEYMMNICTESCTPIAIPAKETSSTTTTTPYIRSASANDEEEDSDDPAERHPGGPRCYYDALAFGCPSSITSDGRKLMCSCDYLDNSWLHVLGKFLTTFRSSAESRASLAQHLGAKIEADGIVSLDVGLPRRLQCGASIAHAYPGTNLEVHVEELYRILGSFIIPEVRQKMLEMCIPGRVALQLICQHVFIHGVKNFQAARAYALKMRELATFVDECIQGETPWPFPGLRKFLKPWQKADYPPEHKMAWYPDPRLMRAKTPDESTAHFFPCVPLKDPECFPTGSQSDYTSCQVCCDPGAGPTGNGACFDAVFTFNRCCQTPGGSGRFY